MIVLVINFCKLTSDNFKFKFKLMNDVWPKTTAAFPDVLLFKNQDTLLGIICTICKLSSMLSGVWHYHHPHWGHTNPTILERPLDSYYTQKCF